jgi:hypothetical protein
LLFWGESKQLLPPGSAACFLEKEREALNKRISIVEDDTEIRAMLLVLLRALRMENEHFPQFKKTVISDNKHGDARKRNMDQAPGAHERLCVLLTT